MENPEDYVPFGILIVLLLLNAFLDEYPKEHNYTAVCEYYGSELKSYDTLEFNCTNGATFHVNKRIE